MGAIKAVFAVDEAYGIGFQGGLPWPPCSEDLTLFKNLTQGSTLFMGRNTYNSLPFGPSKSRPFRVLTNREGLGGISSFLSSTTIAVPPQNSTVIGGTAVLTPEVLKHCTTIIVTFMKGVYKCDTYLPKETIDWLDKLPYEIYLSADKFTVRRYFVRN